MTGPGIVRLFGASHNSTLRIAGSRLTPDDPLSRWHYLPMLGPVTDFFVPFFDSRPDGLFLLNPVHIERCAPVLCDDSGRLRLEDGTFSVISIGTGSTLLLSGARWKTHSHWRTEAARTRLGLTDAAFRAMVYGQNTHILSFYAELRRRAHRFAVLFAPPPTRRYVLLERGYTAQDVLFLDRRYRAELRGALTKLDVQVIMPPDTVTDPEGFLRDEFLMEDETDRHHGNPDYAALVLDMLRTMIGPHAGAQGAPD